MPDRLYHECRELISQGRAALEDLRDAGYDLVSLESAELPVCPIVPEPQAVPGATCRPASLEEIEARLQGCTRCTLCEQRKKIVFGVGNQQADMVLVGEAPGREEDEQGFPFVGEAGRLLDRILFAMKLSRKDVYICNVVKCRPPKNRDPQPEEIAACEQFLRLQLQAIKPRMIVTLGRFAAQTLLQTKAPIGRLRGHWSSYQGIPLMPTFHPAYLLRNPSGKADVWQDMKQVLLRLRNSSSS